MKVIESFGTLKLNGLTSNDIQDIMQTVVNTAKQQLQQFAQTAEFTDKMIQTFGTSPAGLQSAWANNVVILPTIEIVSSSDIDSANGAFAAATDRIYIAAEFLTANINNIEAIAKLVLEEYGHKLDTIINDTDTKGDEGAKFAAFVTGENLTASQLAQLDNENDIAKVTLGGNVVEIEKNDSSFDIVFDYRFAAEGAFDDLAKQRLEEAARIWSSFIADEFPNIPIGTEISIRNPRTDQIETIILDREIDDILIFVDAQPIDARAFTTPQPDTPFPDRYNGSDFQPWIGFITFDTQTTFANIELNLHEIGHVLGIGVAPIYDQQIITNDSGTFFDGTLAKLVNNGNPIPLESETDTHIQFGFNLGDGIVPVLDPGGGSLLPTLVDLAILADIGYEIPVLQSSPLPSKLNYTRNGTDGNDNLYGFDGDDTINGGAGDDFLAGFSNFRDPDGQFPVNDGNDILNGEAGDDYIEGNGGNDILNGGTENDTVLGDDGNDILNGEVGDDYIEGNGGNDALNGGIGNDSLQGNDGSDTFIFELNHGEDLIFDVVGADDVISVAAEFGFSSGAEVLNAITNTFSGTVTIGNETRESLISEIVLSTGNKITIYHDVELTANNFVIANSTTLPTISVNDISMNEGDSGTTTTTFTINLSAPSTDTITVDYSTADQTAIAPQDYTTNNGTITFNPGETTKTITLEITGDTTQEADETFLVNLNNPTNATIADNQGVITIENDDTSVINNNPVANNDSATTSEGTAVIINVLENDTDVENNIDVTTVEIGTQPENGTVTINNETGEITYTPTGDFTGEDSFTYTVQDADGGTSNVGTVNIDVTPVNDNPVANNDSATTVEDRSVIIKVLNNDSDIDGNFDLSTLQIVGQPNNGTLRYISSTGEIVYTPNRNFFGEDSFTYTIQDTNGGTSNVATVNLNVTAVNDVPVAVDDNNTQPEDTEKVPFIINEDTSITIDVLENDVDVEDGIDPETVTIVDQPLNGTVTINENTGEITYTPDDDFFGNDSFTYTVQDTNTGTSNTATVDIRVNSVNDNPVANDDTATTEIGKSVIINVLNNDTDIELGNLTVSVENPNSANAFFYVNPLTGEIIYTPEVNFIGNDSFEYTITDANGGTSTARVNVSVTAEDIINPNPIDNNNFIIQEDNSVIIHLLDDEENAENITENSIIDIITEPNSGTVILNQVTREIAYTPNSNFVGNDSFTYTIFGGTQLINKVINITVQPVNDTPVAVNDNFRTDENESVNISVLDNDIEVETDINDLNITVEDNPRNGTVSVNSNGTITYTPNNNFFGVDSFTYTIEDENDAVSNVARVEVIVDPINDLPVAVDDVVTTEQGSSLVIDILNNDIDVEGEIDITTLNIESQPTNGTVQIISTTGEIIYTPTGDFIGEDSFTYTVKEIDDGDDNNEIANGETSNVATVRINVNPINVPPVANDDIVTTQEDTTVVINVLGNDVDTNFDLSSVQIGSNPNNGTVTVNTTTGTISYRPNDNFAGEDSFTYTVRDTNGVVSNVANVAITVNPVNDNPVANNDAVVTQQGENITINVLNNDSDVENEIDVTTVQIVSNPNGGTVTVNATTGEVTYAPDSDFLGNDSFTYTVKDTDGGTSNVGRVNVFVNPSDENNTPPVANNDSVTTVQNTSLVIDVLTNDEDAEENIDITTVEVDSNPENGRVSVDETTGQITYLPGDDFIGTDSFTYRVRDRNGVNSNAAMVNVIVNRFDPEPANFNSVQILDLDGDLEQTKQLKISFVSQNTSFINEIGVFRVDNAQGTINGLTPDDPEYLQTALTNSQVVFSSLPNNVLGGVDFTRQLNFNGSDRLVFYLVQNSTTQTVLSDIAAGRSPANVLFALPNANSNNFDPVEISELDQRTFSLAWKDSINGNQTAFDDFVINVEILQTDSTPIGTGLQGEIELIDLRGLGTLTATFNVASEAAFNNTVGWYIVDDETGRIGNLRPGDRGYAQIAISQRNVTNFTREGQDSARLQGLLAPYLIADSSIDDFLEDNPLNVPGDGPLAYFAFSAANPDGVDHIVMLGDNTFGFEDLENGGDRDFNDIIMRVNFV